MKKIILLSLCVFLYSCGNIDGAKNRFVEGSKDIPLAKNLTKLSDDPVEFDIASGSVISASYKSNKDLQKIRQFYLETLPQMGWNQVIKDKKTASHIIRFKRDNEKLEIEFVDKDGEKLVKFFIQSSAKSKKSAMVD